MPVQQEDTEVLNGAGPGRLPQCALSARAQSADSWLEPSASTSSEMSTASPGKLDKALHHLPGLGECGYSCNCGRPGCASCQGRTASAQLPCHSAAFLIDSGPAASGHARTQAAPAPGPKPTWMQRAKKQWETEFYNLGMIVTEGWVQEPRAHTMAKAGPACLHLLEPQQPSSGAHVAACAPRYLSAGSAEVVKELGCTGLWPQVQAIQDRQTLGVLHAGYHHQHPHHLHLHGSTVPILRSVHHQLQAVYRQLYCRLVRAPRTPSAFSAALASAAQHWHLQGRAALLNIGRCACVITLCLRSFRSAFLTSHTGPDFFLDWWKPGEQNGTSFSFEFM